GSSACGYRGRMGGLVSMLLDPSWLPALSAGGVLHGAVDAGGEARVRDDVSAFSFVCEALRLHADHVPRALVAEQRIERAFGPRRAVSFIEGHFIVSIVIEHHP